MARTICRHIIIISVISVSSVRIVDAGNIVHFRNVTTDSSLDEEIQLSPLPDYLSYPHHPNPLRVCLRLFPKCISKMNILIRLSTNIIYTV